jgi:hypothetical protein
MAKTISNGCKITCLYVVINSPVFIVLGDLLVKINSLFQANVRLNHPRVDIIRDQGNETTVFEMTDMSKCKCFRVCE